ncbi:MAG: LamG domain-containing protein, partial [Bacteroidota bacterium]
MTGERSLTPGVFTHVAVTVNEKVAVDGKDYYQLKFYINGVLEATWTGTSVPPTNSSPLVFGQRGDGIYYMDGFLDEVRYWNVTRSQTDIRDNMCSSLTGSETGLVGYWKLDDGSDTTATDDAGSFDGTLTSGPTWNTSGAPIGDASTYLYTNSWSGQTLSLSSPEGDFVELSNVTNTPDGMVLYRVDNTPNSSTGISGLGDNAHYFGVFKSNGASTTYTMTYNYAGNDGYQAGVPDADLRIYQRDDNSVTTWTTTTTTLNAVNQTLTATGQNTEYILGSSSGGAVLPIELGSFSAKLTPYGVDVFWTTMAEINNDYFLVERSQNGKDDWQLIGRTRGAGNSSDPLHYDLNDPSPLPGNSYYRLTQV